MTSTDWDDVRLRQAGEQLSDQTKGLCGDQRSFKLGAHGTVLAACGLPPGHQNSLDGEPGETYPKHIARKEDSDGASVTFTWE